MRKGLAEDVRHYGQWMRDEAEKRIGHFYPPVEMTAEMVKERPDLTPNIGQKLTVIAWLWARTVKSPNPAFRHVDVPLASHSFSPARMGKKAYVQPVIEGRRYRFSDSDGMPPAGGEKRHKANARCKLSLPYIRRAYRVRLHLRRS